MSQSVFYVSMPIWDKKKHVSPFWMKNIFLKSQSNKFCLSHCIFIVSMPRWDKKFFLDLDAICFVCLRLFSQKGWAKKNILVFFASQLMPYVICIQHVSFFPMTNSFLRSQDCISLVSVCSLCLVASMRQEKARHSFEWKTYFLNLNAEGFTCLGVFSSSHCLDETKRIF